MPDQYRFRSIDQSSRGDHYHLSPEDNCVYLMEYTAGAGFGFGDANNLISNLKKSPRLKDQPQYHYKRVAMRRCANLIQQNLSIEWLRSGTIIPIPPSKTADHPDFDDRMSRICRAVQFEGRSADVRDLLKQRASTDAAHESPGRRPTIPELIANYYVDDELSWPTPTSILLVDDVLTAGSHFKAAKFVIGERFPDVEIFGAFIARRALPKPAAAFD